MRLACLLALTVGCAGGKAVPGDAANAGDAPQSAVDGSIDAPAVADAPSPVIDAPVAPTIDAPPAAVCGNGVVEPGEQCDDGNTIDTDACRNSCAWAACGDGVVRTGVEECDDGNTADGDACSSGCLSCNGGDAHYSSPTSHACYTRYDSLVAWNAARDACAAAKGWLVTFGDAAEDSEVTTALLAGVAPTHWFDIDDIAVEGTFVWDDDEPVVYTNWTPGEPNDSAGAEDCGEIYPTGMWNDRDCAATNGYVCEDDGWRIAPTDHHAYRFVKHLVDWNGAVAECAAMGGHLATVSSTAENDFIASYEYGDMWLGANDIAVDGAFVWITGEPFSFMAWAAGEPNNAGGPEDCLQQRRGLGWNDSNCAALFGYVCEIE